MRNFIYIFFTFCTLAFIASCNPKGGEDLGGSGRCYSDRFCSKPVGKAAKFCQQCIDQGYEFFKSDGSGVCKDCLAGVRENLGGSGRCYSDRFCSKPVGKAAKFCQQCIDQGYEFFKSDGSGVCKDCLAGVRENLGGKGRCYKDRFCKEPVGKAARDCKECEERGYDFFRSDGSGVCKDCLAEKN